MRIAHVTATFPPYWAGTGNVAYHNARVLHERGHDVTVFTARPTRDEEMTFPFEVEYLPAVFRLGNAPLTPGLLHRLRGFDVIHLHLPYIFGAELTAAAAALYRTPLVATYHNDLLAPGGKGRVFEVYNEVSVPRILRRLSRLVVTSHDYAANSTLAGKTVLWRQAVEVPNGVDTTVFKPRGRSREKPMWDADVPAGAPTILFVGAMDQAHFFKGVPILLEALAGIPDAHAVLVGEGDLRAVYQQQADRDLPGRAHFLGRRSLPELIRAYQDATVTVLPSTTAGEAFGMVLLESLACGTPVVASDLPGVRTVVRDGVDGFLAAPADSAALGAALRRILSDPIQAAAMGQRGLAKVRHGFGWDSLGSRLEGIYASALTGAPRLEPGTSGAA